MSPQLIQLIAAAYSMKSEIKVIAFTLIAICLLPIFTVLILTQEGIDIISGSLATRDPQTTQVQIHNPATGEVEYTLDTSVEWPVNGPVSLEFGQPDLPYELLHTGIDIASPTHEVGTPVVAFMDGTVTYADQTLTGYGKHVIIDNGHHITSLYGHLDTLNVTKGQPIKMGDVLGTRGTTGWSTGPHLHFEIDVYGIPVNPRTFLTGDP
jgi:murein DD-endopeptidase MepM/ murein hydrolase activator NlpD